MPLWEIYTASPVRFLEYSGKERELMIRVIIKRQIVKGKDIAALLRQLRVAAMPYPGYVSGENLISTKDRHVITVISTWRSLEDWRKWEASEQRARINRGIEPLLVEPPLIETYEIMSTEEQEYLEDPTGWLAEKEHPSFDG